MKVIVCGDRNWTDRNAIRKRIKQLPSNTIIIHGAAKGADSIAGQVATNLGFDVIAIPAKWHKYGKGAGPIRNKEMLDMNPNLVIAFHSDIKNSKGTKNMVAIAHRAKIDVELINGRS